MHLTKSSIARVCGLALGILLVGCGSSGSSTDQSAALVGSWTYTSGSIDPMCNLSISPFDLTGDTMTITKIDDTHVQTMLTGSGVMCDVKFTVNNGVATAETGQTCAVTEMVTIGTPMNITVNIMITSWTMTVSGDSLTMAMNGTASAVGGALTCTPMASGTATRPSSGG